MWSLVFLPRKPHSGASGGVSFHSVGSQKVEIGSRVLDFLVISSLTDSPAMSMTEVWGLYKILTSTIVLLKVSKSKNSFPQPLGFILHPSQTTRNG